MAINTDYSFVNNLYGSYQAQKTDNNTASNQTSLFNNSQNGDTFEFSNATNPNSKQLSTQNNQINELKKTDNNVKVHEGQHQSAAGIFGSSPVYNYTLGPDGQNYAIGGHVNIQVKKDSDPNKTIQNAEIVKKAALAPSDPSGQDLKVASEAEQNINKAKTDLNKKNKNQNANATGSKLNVVG